MAVEDAAMTRMVQRELGRRYVDSSRLDVRVTHGVCYLRGVLEKLRFYPEVDLEYEAELIRKLLRQKPGIREVIWEVYVRAPR